MNYYYPPQTQQQTQQQQPQPQQQQQIYNVVDNSLPPLSHLLPSDTSSNNNNNNNEENVDYFSPTHQTANPPLTNEKELQTGPVVSSHPPYRKSIDYQRSHMPPPTTTHIRRNYISPHQNGYCAMPPHLSSFVPPAPPAAIVPSSDLSVFPPPPPPPIYHAGRSHGNLYHLPSPPTSVIDGVLVTDPHQQIINGGITNNSQKVFSFVPLPGLNQKKRPRRKFHEVERLYQCNFQDCTKSYGTLNHLNAHVSMQRHGPKRQPSEFRELRKMWRKQKREHKQRSSNHSRATTQSLEEDGHPIPTMHHHENTVLSHPMIPPPSSSSPNRHPHYHTHDYATTMPTYMPPPPPHSYPPPTENAPWINGHRYGHEAVNFLPQGY